LELEVFSRVPWGDSGAQAPQEPARPPGAAATAAPAAAVPSVHEESAFEVFGRPKRGGPPVSKKGEERLAYAEIELEPTAHAPTEAPEAVADDSPFEVFTREPRRPAGAAGARPQRTEGGAFADLELEQTAYTPIDVPLAAGQELPGFEPTIGAPAAAPPEEPEIPLEDFAIDLAPEESAPPPPPPFVPDVPDVPEVPEVPDDVLEEPWEPPPAPKPPPEVKPAPAPVADAFESAFNLEEELPQIDLAREFEHETGDEEPDAADEPGREQEPGRGVFDTETLATIYINQGFYGRAAEIFQRLIDQRPGDAGLRQKLDDVLALERMGRPAAAATAAPAPAAVPVATPPAAPPPKPAPPAAAPASGADQHVRRLQTLLEAFKGGPPR